MDSLYSSFSICLKNAKKEECAKVIKEQLIDKLDALFPPYTEFEKGFTVLKYSGKKELTSNMKVKYIVNHINNYYSKTKESALDGSVEHIVSESEGEESQNIGNLILLEASINSSAGNEPYEIKKTDYYVNSNYKWIKQFIVEHEKWDISMAESRAVAMAELYYTKILGRGK